MRELKDELKKGLIEVDTGTLTELNEVLDELKGSKDPVIVGLCMAAALVFASIATVTEDEEKTKKLNEMIKDITCKLKERKKCI